MNKMIKSALFLTLLSTSLYAGQSLEAGSFDAQKQEFFVGASKRAEGKYEIKNEAWEAEFAFRQGKLDFFSFDEKAGNDLEIEGKFVEAGKEFQGEIELKQRKEIDADTKEKKSLEVEGTFEAKGIYDFAKKLWLEREKGKPLSYEEVASLSLLEGKKKVEEELSKSTEKTGSGKSYYQVEMSQKEEVQVFSKGKVVGQSQSSSSRSEVRTKLEGKKY